MNNFYLPLFEEFRKYSSHQLGGSIESNTCFDG